MHKGFLIYDRVTPNYRPVADRVLDFKEVSEHHTFTTAHANTQATRCMGCGVPFCINGCPLGNVIPDFNEAVRRSDWRLAYQILESTNNFPEFTGRICPAPCESACVLGINRDPVTIEHLERSIVEMAFEQGWVQPKPPKIRTDKTVAVIGSGPAGLAVAMQLNRMGHQVTVFEKDEYAGGLLRLGIPDFKLEKWVVARRIALLEAEGIVFKTGVEIGTEVDGAALRAGFDAVVVCTGAPNPRKLTIPGSDLKGIYPAMDYLTQSNRKVAGATFSPEQDIRANGKHVVVIGGGDTGSDCVGTANRQEAVSVSQLQYRMMPSSTRPEETPWPMVPLTLTTSSSHEEGCERQWQVQTKSFLGDANGHVKELVISDLHWEKNPTTGQYEFQEIAGSERAIPCDLAFIAIGYQGAAPSPLWAQLDISLDAKGLVQTENYKAANSPNVFVAGDLRRGQSLVVWAIAEGRAVAQEVGIFLK